MPESVLVQALRLIATTKAAARARRVFMAERNYIWLIPCVAAAWAAASFFCICGVFEYWVVEQAERATTQSAKRYFIEGHP